MQWVRQGIPRGFHVSVLLEFSAKASLRVRKLAVGSLFADAMGGKGREEDLKLDSGVASPSFTLATGLQARGFLAKHLQQPELWGFCRQHTFERRACPAQTRSASSQVSVGVASCWPSPGRTKLRAKPASKWVLSPSLSSSSFPTFQVLSRQELSRSSQTMPSNNR